MSYTIPEQTKIGHVHLKVSNIDRALAFYRDLLGFNVTQWYGNSAVFLSAGGYHHHIGLNTWYSNNSPAAPANTCGLFHTAILFETPQQLAVATKRLLDHNYPLTGTADHGVSLAIYLNDPDQNGVELYWDRPKEEWPVDAGGNLNMFTRPLEITDLMQHL